MTNQIETEAYDYTIVLFQTVKWWLLLGEMRAKKTI